MIIPPSRTLSRSRGWEVKKLCGNSLKPGLCLGPLSAGWMGEHYTAAGRDLTFAGPLLEHYLSLPLLFDKK